MNQAKYETSLWDGLTIKILPYFFNEFVFLESYYAVSECYVKEHTLFCSVLPPCYCALYWRSVIKLFGSENPDLIDICSAAKNM